MEAKFMKNFKEILEMEDIEIQMSDRFREYERWDSLAYLSLIAMMDEEYDIQIEGNEFKKLNTIQDLMDAIKERTKNGGN